MGRFAQWWVIALLAVIVAAQGWPVEEDKPETKFNQLAAERASHSVSFPSVKSAGDFGSKALPLRAAVESIPPKLFRDALPSTRTPLRDAVEHRPPAYDEDLIALTKDFESLGIDPWRNADEKVENNDDISKNTQHMGDKKYVIQLDKSDHTRFSQLSPLFMQPTIRNLHTTPQPQKVSPSNHYYGAAQSFNTNNTWQSQNQYSAYNDPKKTMQGQDFRIDNENQQILRSEAEAASRLSMANVNLNEMRQTQTADWLPEEYTPMTVCYVNSRAVDRTSPFDFSVATLPGDKCTHVHYMFATLHTNTYAIMPSNEDYDVIQGGYRITTGLKQEFPLLRTVISVGGEESQHLIAQMVSQPHTRSAFADSVTDFIQMYEFDGLDLHWIYSGDAEQGGTKTDKDNLNLLLAELREKFNPNGWILSLVLPSSRKVIEGGYDLQTISSLVDYTVLHAWRDARAGFEPRGTQHHSPLYRTQHRAEDRNQHDAQFDNVNSAVKYLLGQGLVNEKLVLGVPFFGRSFTLLGTPVSGDTAAPALGWGRPGDYTHTNGQLAYFEICMSMLQTGTHMDRDGNGSPYVVLGDQWISFDDKDSIMNKMLYVRWLRLGGAAAWSADADDASGACGEQWALLSTLTDTLRGKPIENSDDSRLKPLSSCKDEEDSLASNPESCAEYSLCRRGVRYQLACPRHMLFDPSTGHCGYIDVSKCVPGHSLQIPIHKQYVKSKNRITNVVSSVKQNVYQQRASEESAGYKNADGVGSGKKSVCYITNWAFYRRGEGKFVPEQLESGLCTHVVYAYATLDTDTLTLKEFDPWTDIDNELYARVTSLKNVKVLLGVGGWTDSSGDKWSRLAGSSAARRRFVSSLVSFLHAHKFTGLHLDWNYPVCWQSNCSKGAVADRRNFVILLQEISKELKRQTPKMELGIALSGYKEIIDVAYDLPALGEAADFLSAMTYDYHGGWEHSASHGSPLTPQPGDSLPQYTIEYTIKHLIDNGAPPSKLLLGLAFYGQSFRLDTNQPESGTAMSRPASGPGEPGEFTKQPGMLAYYEICYRIKNLRWQSGRQPGAGPYTYDHDQWVGYEDQQSITEKVKWAMGKGLGGIVAWTADLDDFSNRCCLESFPLLRAANRALGRPVQMMPAKPTCRRPPPPVTPPPPTMTSVDDSGAPVSSTAMTSATTWPTWNPSTSSSTSTSTQQTWWPTTTTTTTSSSTHQTWWPTSSPSPTTTSTTRPATTQSSLENDGEMCSPGTFTAVPGDCSSYFHCVGGEYQRQRCATGLHWHAAAHRCDWPRAAHCKVNQQTSPVRPVTTTLAPVTSRPPLATSPTTPSTTARPATTTRRTVTTTRRPTTTAGLKPGMSCTSGGYYAHEKCENFYICVNGALLAQSCAPGLAWNENNKMCDFITQTSCNIDRVRQPDGRPSEMHRRTTTTTTRAPSTTTKTTNTGTTTRRTPPQTLSSNCQNGEYSGYPGDCRKYRICIYGKYQSFSCGFGLEWSQSGKICDWPRRASCVPSNNIHEDGEPHEDGQVDEHVIEVEATSTTTTTRHPTTTSTTTRRPTTTTTTTVQPTTTISVAGSINSHYKVVCYFTNWAWYRPGVGKYVPEDIDASLCTHIVYGFAVLDHDALVIKAHDSWADFDNKFYERVVAYKKRGLKVSLALGGWNDSAGDKYSRLVGSPAARARFVRHALAFMQKYDFDGLDLDWEYPKCWQVDCSKGPESDKSAFAALVQELSAEMKPLGLLLSSAVSPSKTVIDAAYDVPAIAAAMDWIAVMTYDFHGQWDKKTGHVAPLYYHPEDDVTYFNSNYSINYWIEKGAPPRKLIMGLPMYGQSFTLGVSWDTPSEQLARRNETGLNVPARSGGQAGEFTRASGFLAYYEICDRVKNRGWKVKQDPRGRMGPYAYKGDQWVSFDDAAMIRKKTQFVRSLNLGGAMIWALDLDDFRNRCGEGKHPLLNNIRNVLASPPSHEELTGHIPEFQDTDSESNVQFMNTSDKEQLIESHSQSQPATSHNELPSETSLGHGDSNEVDTPLLPKPQSDSQYKVVCYFTNWAWYRPGPGKYSPGDIDPELCTHIVYGFAVLDGSQLIIKPHDSWADIDNKFYEKVTALKAKGIKVLIAIGGWNDSAGDKYSRLVNDPAARKRFIIHVVDFIKKWNFDGLDLDWEYPKCWQVDCTKGPASDKSGFAALVTELRESFRPHKFLLSSAVSPSRRVVEAGYDVPVLSKMLDWIAVMAYDYHGQWDKKTGHVAPMYEMPDDADKTFNTNFTIHYWIEQGADRKKLVMGMPMYGQSFSLALATDNGLNAPTYGGGEAGEETRARGFLSFYEICERIKKRGWKVHRDSRGRIGPYATLGDQWVSFDDDHMIRHKSEYIKAMGLGGGMIWALDLDDFGGSYCGCGRSPLLSTVNAVLRAHPSPPPCALEGTAITSSSTHRPPPQSLQPDTSDEDSADTLEVDAATAPDNDDDVFPGAPCDGRVFSPDPQDCNKYFLCNLGVLQRQACPAGLHWNVHHCDWPSNAQCLSAHSLARTQDLPIDSLPRYLEPRKLICYFASWASHRSDNGRFTPEDFDGSLCTHVVYSYAVLDPLTLTMVPKDPLTDVENDFYGKITALREKGIKVLIALGDYEDSGTDKYRRLAASPAARDTFVKEALKFLDKWHFDGLEVSWLYPVCLQEECRSEDMSKHSNVAVGLASLLEALSATGRLLSARVWGREPQAAQDVGALAQYLDWVSVAAYHYAGHGPANTHFSAPLYAHNDPNVNGTLNWWLSAGVPSEKLVLGVGLYAQTFTVRGAAVGAPGQVATGLGRPGPATQTPGFLAFYEICQLVSSGNWSMQRDAWGGSTAWHSDQWASLADTHSMWDLAALASAQRLGGVAAWAAHLDDWRGLCGCGTHPLLHALYYSLRGLRIYSEPCP